MISAISCPRDGGVLSLAPDQTTSIIDFVKEGRLQCGVCDAIYLIEGGILRLLEEEQLTGESARERAIRDIEAEDHGAAQTGNPYHVLKVVHEAIEVLPTLAALESDGRSILELGCGTGRFTRILADSCKEILAVDFSSRSLQILAKNLDSKTPVGLVQADVTKLKVQQGKFDVVLSTLVSNLPTKEDRLAIYRLASEAISETGRFVFTAHHFGIRQRLTGEVQSGRYSEGGIFRYLFTLGEISAGIKDFFSKVKLRPIQIYIPFAGRLKLPLVPISRISEKIPCVNLLGSLILCTAQKPVKCAFR